MENEWTITTIWERLSGRKAPEKSVWDIAKELLEQEALDGKNFDEKDHPRKKDGKFKKGSGEKSSGKQKNKAYTKTIEFESGIMRKAQKSVNFSKLTQSCRSAKAKHKSSTHLFDYKNSGTLYQNINDFARKGPESIPEAVRARAAETYNKIKDTINDCQLPEIVLEREASLIWLELITGTKDWRKNPRQLEGKDFTDPGFMSTTAAPNFHFIEDEKEREITMYINAPEGTKGAFIADLEIGKSNGEKEVLLQCGTTLHFNEVKVYNKNIVIKAAVISQE